MTAVPGTGTVLEALLASIEKAAVHNRNVTVAPAAVLWPDEGRQWEPLLLLLRKGCPYLLTLAAKRAKWAKKAGRV